MGDQQESRARDGDIAAKLASMTEEQKLDLLVDVNRQLGIKPLKRPVTTSGAASPSSR